MDIVGILATILMGLALGVFGGGGSILTVPILVYLFKIDPLQATFYSLIIVGSSALFGMYWYSTKHLVEYKKGIIFSIPSLLTISLIRYFLLPSLPNTLFVFMDKPITKNLFIMLFFSLAMSIAAIKMMSSKTEILESSAPRKKQLVFYGFLVGVVTGFAGAGGGFLIVPALVFMAKLPMKKAVGTSLGIIFLNSLIGVLADQKSFAQTDNAFLFKIMALSFVGVIAGKFIADKVDGQTLRPIFGKFILVVGVFIFIQQIYSL